MGQLERLELLAEGRRLLQAQDEVVAEDLTHLVKGAGTLAGQRTSVHRVMQELVDKGEALTKLKRRGGGRVRVYTKR